MNIKRQIEFDKVKDIWASLAITDWGKKKSEKVENRKKTRYTKKTYRCCNRARGLKLEVNEK